VAIYTALVLHRYLLALDRSLVHRSLVHLYDFESYAIINSMQ